MQKIAVVTGASSGIGLATAKKLAAGGWQVILGARRIELLNEIGAQLGAQALYLDVTQEDSVREFCCKLPEKVHLLVNNAGGALGLEPISNAQEKNWLDMYQSNVLGLMRMTRALQPKLIENRGHIVNVTSIAGREVYLNGAGYTAAKHAARAVTETLRLELNGTAVRVTDIAPGMVKTEFSDVRFFGDKDRAAKVYDGVTPLSADDIAECIYWVANLPWHVNIDELVVKPVAQANAKTVARNANL